MHKILACGFVKLFVQCTFLCSPSLVLMWNKYKGLHLHRQSLSDIYDLPKIGRNTSANVPSRTDVFLLKIIFLKVTCNWQMQGGKKWTSVAMIYLRTHSLLKSKPNKCKWNEELKKLIPSSSAYFIFSFSVYTLSIFFLTWGRFGARFLCEATGSNDFDF